MTESFEMLLNRDKNLNKLTELGKSLSEDSARMKKDAKNLKLSYMLRKYMTYIVICAVLLFLIIMKVYVLWIKKYTKQIKKYRYKKMKLFDKKMNFRS